MAVNKCSLDNMLHAVLAVGNAESNMTIPPGIFSDMYSTVTSLLIDRLVEIYPHDSSAVEMLEPFTKINKKPNKKGYYELDDDFRNLLSIAVNIKPGGGDCGDDPDKETPSGFQNANLKSGCRTVPIRMVPQNEWDDLTTSEYAFPTYLEPIGCRFGERKIKVCPYDLPTAEVRYVRQEKTYKYGYIIQPDDTYIFDVNTSVESEWTSAAFTPIFKALMSIYSAYTRDVELRDWALILNKDGIL